MLTFIRQRFELCILWSDFSKKILFVFCILVSKNSTIDISKIDKSLWIPKSSKKKNEGKR